MCIRDSLKALAAHGFQCSLYNAGTADADIDDTVSLCHAVERARHERIIVRRIAEYHQLCTASGILLLCVCLLYTS